MFGLLIRRMLVAEKKLGGMTGSESKLPLYMLYTKTISQRWPLLAHE